MGPWDHLSEEEKMENEDYQNEVRFGGSYDDDATIRQQAMEDFDDDFPRGYED